MSRKNQAGLSQSVSAGLQGEAVTAGGVLAAVGGVRGIFEAVVPALVYLVTFVITQDTTVSVLAPVAMALAFVVWRLVLRQSLVTALSGVLGVGVCVATTLFTGRGEDYFLPGFWINGVWILALSVSLLVGWPLIGFIVGTLQGDMTGWRKHRRVRNIAGIASVLWLVLFAVRLAVQLPLYFSGQVAALGVARLVMGTPLFALVLVCTWLLFRHVAPVAKQEKE